MMSFLSKWEIFLLFLSQVISFSDLPWYAAKKSNPSNYEIHPEIQHSITKPPWGLVDNKIPFWKPFGSTIFHAGHISLTPNARDKTGQLWNTKMFHHSIWEMEAVIAIGLYKGETENPQNGFENDERSMSIWYTTKFVNTEVWEGIAIFFVNGRSGSGNIYAIANDGTKSITRDMYDSNALGVCRNVAFKITDRDYEYDSRHPEKDHNAFHIRIEYDNGDLALKYYMETSNSDNPSKHWNDCFRHQIHGNFPKNGFFGFYAINPHNNAEHHDLLRALVKSVSDDHVNTDLFKEQGLIELGQNKHHKKLNKQLEELHELTDLDKTFEINRKTLEDLSGLDKSSMYYAATKHLQEIELKQFKQIDAIAQKFSLMHDKLADVDQHINEGTCYLT